MVRKEDQDPCQPPNVAAATPKKCSGYTTDRARALRYQLGLLLPVLSPALVSWPVSYVLLEFLFTPQHQAQFAFLVWPHPVFFITSQVGGAPRSGIYGVSKARNKDQRDPREKRFPSSVLFIIPLLLPLKAPPFSTVAPLYILGTPFSPVPVTALSPGKRGECVETVNVNVWRH